MIAKTRSYVIGKWNGAKDIWNGLSDNEKVAAAAVPIGAGLGIGESYRDKDADGLTWFNNTIGGMTAAPAIGVGVKTLKDKMFKGG